MSKKSTGSSHSNNQSSESARTFSAELLEMANLETESVLGHLETRLAGLSTSDADLRLKRYGVNEFAKEKRLSVLMHLVNNLKNPLVILLAALALLSYLTGDLRATLVISVMIVLGIILRFFQELRADNAAAALKAMVSNKATVVRDGKEEEIPLKLLVPGDIISIAAGDMIPADVRILSAKDLFLNQSALTGEAMPVEKSSDIAGDELDNPLEIPNLCFLGSNVVSGTGIAAVIHTGGKTYFGALSASIVEKRELTSFDKGINGITWMMIRFIAVMVPIVFLVNGFSKHNWMEAFLFAMAVAVGLTPEMLPMIVSVNLSKGAMMMSRKKVIVKRLNSIQNLGAMDVLCTDKTGTLTEGEIVLEKHLDVHGETSAKVLHYGYLNSYHHTGLRNITDEAILKHGDLEETLQANVKYHKIDEIPFDFTRKRMSVIVEDETGMNTLICKGAVEQIMSCCSRVEIDGNILPMLPEYKDSATETVSGLNAQGFRAIALSYKEMPGAPDEPVYEIGDESELILLGFLTFFDPPKKSAPEALKQLETLSVDVKILTGDNEVVSTYICKEVGLSSGGILLGPQIEAMSEDELAKAVNNTSIFARLSPNQKELIIHALQKNGHVVGFMGDGINDAPALKASDVSVSVDSAVDIAKESSDIILLDNNLLVLAQGVMEGRRVFGNIIKYIKMAASSNFGNMFSVVGASAFLPFLPMLPIQVLTNNLLYDFSQTTIPSDEVDSDWLKKPRQWKIRGIEKFILIIGPISSIFDYLTFFIMLNIFNCWNNPALFHTGWFVESIFTQTMIIHVIRTNKIPFIQSRASWPLIISSVAIVSAAVFLTISPLAKTLGFVPLPSFYWFLLAVMMVCYVVLTQLVKTWFIRKFGD
ncbi:magnesium-translocating P-type ATPase [Parasporobacterium paucivorans]|uniref:Magnesium-transporting ATPase, P-type 1 n=1 Tax=Parasporobacterium paucivorans DSM 15970 TaxID=1122934 RepID=A0A1M6CYZ8_9FIRM|nr:magnesium-translocating P-type ATPase [Parasporobacterium paucivorans]SHI65948.1 Mg2+-importing ATPase [Parasporobacterium paucivorans DSM 15970]